jgi:ribose/xylose/arabinose/galactoside ABC-type transport system permease subunit
MTPAASLVGAARGWAADLSYLLPALVVLVVVVSILQPRFATFSNFQNVARQAAPLGILAVAQMFPLITAGLDFSQVGALALVSVVTAHAMLAFGIAAGIVAGLALGFAIGVGNGTIIATLKVSPFIVTLGMLSVLQGIALLITSGAPVLGLPESFGELGSGYIGSIPASAVLAFGVFLFAYWVLNRTRSGRRLYAIGGNPEAARLAGIAVIPHQVLAYAISGMLTALAAIVLTSRQISGAPNLGGQLGLQAIAAAVIGGVSLFGGEGRVFGVFLGVSLLILLSNSLDLLNVSSYIQTIITGGVIICAVIVDRLRHFRGRG